MTVSGNVGADVNVSTDATVAPGGYTRIFARTSVGATATGSASFRLLPWLGRGLGGSVELDGELMKNTVTTNVTVDARPVSVILKGGISYILDPIILKLKACGYYGAGSVCKTVMAFTAPRVSLPNLLLR